MSGSRRRGQASDPDRGAGIEHPFDLPVGYGECCGGVSHSVEAFSVRGEACVRTGAEGWPAPGGALRGDEPLVGVRVATREHGSEVRPVHGTAQPGLFCGPAVPPAGFLATVGVVPLYRSGPPVPDGGVGPAAGAFGGGWR